MKGRVSAANAPMEGARVVPPIWEPSRQSARVQSSGAGACGVEARGVDRVGADVGAEVTVVEPAANLVPVLEAACPRFEGFPEMGRFG